MFQPNQAVHRKTQYFGDPTWLTLPLLAPGVRYRALHRLLPPLPCHELGEWRRVPSSLRPGFVAALAKRRRAATATPLEQSAMRKWAHKANPPRTS